MSWHSFRPYVSASERRAKAKKKIAAMQAKGRDIRPLGELTHRAKIATSFWGRAWCQHLEAFSDYENRLPRGRAYARNGSVCHLGIAPGRIDALVQGSELYEISIAISPLDAKKWERIQSRCQGRIASLIKLLRGEISDEIMTVVTDRDTGLFPLPKEIKMSCSCPDWAGLCKHLAAVLYGVGARLDTEPALLFTLRQVDHQALITTAAADTLTTGGSRRKRLDAGTVSAIFGEDFEEEPSTPAPATPPRKETRLPTPRPARISSPPKAAKAPTPKVPPPAKKSPRRATPRKTPKKPAASEPLEATAAAVRALRARLGLSRSTFAARLRVPVATVARWERASGPLQWPAATARKLARLKASA